MTKRRVALVTGGARGIGLAIASQLAREGFDLAVCGTRSADAAADAVRSLREQGGEVLYASCDVGDRAARAELVESVRKRFGRLHVLVNNAGVAPLQRRDLLDANLPEEEKWIRNEIGRLQLPIRGFHHLRTRKAGAIRFVDLHVMMDKDISIQESHRISEQVAAMIRQKFPTTQVMVHEEPCEGGCSTRCLDGCLRSEGERQNMQQC